MEATLQFDIFRGRYPDDSVWLAAVEGLSAARERMERLAAEKPGAYFIYSTHTRQVLAVLNTACHYHILWNGTKFDWERHGTRESAEEGARALAASSEVFTIEEVSDDGCPHCSAMKALPTKAKSQAS